LAADYQDEEYALFGKPMKFAGHLRQRNSRDW